jgi:hypothetical protein
MIEGLLELRYQSLRTQTVRTSAASDGRLLLTWRIQGLISYPTIQ